MTLSTGTTGLSHVKKIYLQKMSKQKHLGRFLVVTGGWGGTTSSASPIVLFVI
ncbi:hypothetical protein RHGRI_012241 [Rhododendron griersonianum]|uniref:Uncharacterized protein n=1 Tax=Rhododendron griersonianum TaxID=479676 RepID=A0AAV6KR16_9ERIC|nr:hypothetical protein RHGRI_012241 [Rhododendron griersonianum]